MTSAHLVTPEFEQALKRACLRAVARAARHDPLRSGDVTAVLHGPLISEIADEADLSLPQARRRLQALQRDGKVIRDDRRGGSTAWWLVGLACDQAPSAPVKQAAPMAITLSAATPAQKASIDGLRQALTPARQHWSDVLGVARDCSTSEARDAFRERLAAVPEHDLDADQQRQRIRDAFDARLIEDGISE
jgi:hypothetical protein